DEGQDGHDHNDQADEINDAVQETLQLLTPRFERVRLRAVPGSAAIHRPNETYALSLSVRRPRCASTRDALPPCVPEKRPVAGRRSADPVRPSARPCAP